MKTLNMTNIKKINLCVYASSYDMIRGKMFNLHGVLSKIFRLHRTMRKQTNPEHETFYEYGLDSSKDVMPGKTTPKTLGFL